MLLSLKECDMKRYLYIFRIEQVHLKIKQVLFIGRPF